jgi:hypothetical protein
MRDRHQRQDHGGQKGCDPNYDLSYREQEREYRSSDLSASLGNAVLDVLPESYVYQRCYVARCATQNGSSSDSN